LQRFVKAGDGLEAPGDVVRRGKDIARGCILPIVGITVIDANCA
jgi:hypothetical protein